MEVYTQKLKSGESVVRYRFRHAGKPYTGTIRNKSLKEAREEAVAIRADVMRGIGRAPGKSQALADFIHETYLPWAKPRKRSAYDDGLICKVICEFFGRRRLSEITAKHVREFQDWRLATPVGKDEEQRKHGKQRSNNTVNREMSVLSAVFRQAVREGHIHINPCHNVEALPRDEGVKRFLSQDEYARLLAQLSDTRAHLLPVVQIAVFTGLRQEEQLTLRRRQIDFEHGLIRLDKTKTRRGRVVPMLPLVRELLNGLCANLEADDWVFPSPHPKHPGERLAFPARGFNKACELAGLADLRWHDLRHTFATWLAMAGTPVEVIKTILGHTDVRTTMIYTHVAAETARAAMDNLALWQERQKNGKKLADQERSASQVLYFPVDQRGIEPLTSALRMREVAVDTTSDVSTLLAVNER